MKRKIFIIILFLFFLPCTTASLSDDLVAYWNFNEGSGKLIDRFEGKFNGTNNGADYSASGILNDAYDFELDNTDYVEIDSDNLNTGFSEISVSFWYKSETQGTGTTNFIFHQTVGGIFCSLLGGDGALQCGMAGSDLDGEVYASGKWQHIVMTIIDDGDAKLYVNGTEVDTSTIDISGLDGTFYIGTRIDNNAQAYDGLIDEFGYWNRSLTTNEISSLYNSGGGLEYPFYYLKVELQDPPNNSRLSSDISFNATLTPNFNYNITNATLRIWNSTALIYENLTSYVNQNSSIKEDWVVKSGNFSSEDYYWNVYGCNYNGVSTNCTYQKSNYTFEWEALSVDSTSYSASVLETSSQRFEVNVTIIPGYTVKNAFLVYNGTSYSGVGKTSIDSDSYNLVKTIEIPAGKSGFISENRSFFWNISIIDETTGKTKYETTSEYSHNVTEMVFGLCDGIIYDVPLLNFTLYDEKTNIIINSTSNATTFQATFNIGATSGTLIKNYSINNLTVNENEFDFCTSNYTSSIYTDMNLYYTAVGYTDKNYYLNDATLTNVTREINLYLLTEDNALEFFIDVEQDLDPIEDATINVDKYFVGEGVYKTVEIDETDVDGEFTAYLDLDKKYKFTITKDGEVLGTIYKTASCKEAPCEITLSLTSDADNPFQQFDSAFASNVVYNLSFNPSTKMVTFDFVDTSGLADYFRMIVKQSYLNQSSITISDQKLYTSSGTMTFNATNHVGDFKVEVYVSRSPENFIDFIKFVISDITEDLGLLGLFSALLFIVVLIFGLSFKPSVLMIAVPLGLTIIKLGGIITLSNTSLVLIYVLAVAGMVVISR